jgi:carboxyl-terminal processing protease
LIVVAPIEGFPASKAGLRPQDMIVSIDDTTTSNMTIDEAVSRIRGEKGHQSYAPNPPQQNRRPEHYYRP